MDSGGADLDIDPQPVGVRNRIVALSDNVFGFAATLLAARLVLPIVEGERATIEVLFDRLSTIGIFMFGFLVIGYQWWRHHQVFERVERADNRLIIVNLVMLACIAFMPYPTSVLGESQVELAAALFVVPLLGSSLALVAMWHHATSRDLTAPDGDRGQHLLSHLLILPGVLTISLVLIPVSVLAAAVAWIALPVALVAAHLLDPADDEDAPVVARRHASRGSIDHGLERLVAYSDGIYAVVLTIIANQLGGSEGEPMVQGLSSAQLWEQLQGQLDTFVAFGLAFYTIGLFWTVHAEMFGRIVRFRTPLLWLALVHLMVIALQPFGLSVFLDLGSADSSAATATYLLFMLTASLTLTAVGQYADWGRRCVPASTTHTQIVARRWQSAAAAGIFCLGAAIALLTDDGNSGWAFAVFALFSVTDRLIRRRYADADDLPDEAGFAAT